MTEKERANCLNLELYITWINKILMLDLEDGRRFLVLHLGSCLSHISSNPFSFICADGIKFYFKLVFILSCISNSIR